MKNRHDRRTKCANTRLSNDLTVELRERILNLRESVSTDYLKEEVFSKFISDETDPSSLRRERAIAKWLMTEERNAETTERLFSTHEEYNILPRVTFGRFVSFCQDTIAALIGETVPTEALMGTFSGGASTSRPRTDSHPASKYLGKAHVTPRALPWFDSLRGELPQWVGVPELPFAETAEERLELEVVPGNVMFTVLKKTDIDRVACKEPDINMWLQKGIGSFLRNRLKKVGVDLNDQSKNWRLAREGSLTGALATIDLSSASDSVSSGLVELLLPPLWYNLLDDVRSQVTTIPRGSFVEVHRNEMFSSMGNGFTFELESLLFWVLCRATAYFEGVSGVISVYGDDIICPSEIYSSFEWVLNYFGFKVNPEKSFSTGPFRESCGGHFYDGRDITPFYVKEPIRSLVDVMHAANQLRAWASRQTNLSILDPEVESIWCWLASFVPKHLWGGTDPSFKYQLVSNGMSAGRLVEEKSKPRDLGKGGYLLWLNATQGRRKATEGVQTSSSKKAMNVFRWRSYRTPTVTSLPTVWLSELDGDAEYTGE